MRTIIEFKDGRTDTTEDGAPSVQMEDRTVCLVDGAMSCISEEFSLDDIARVIFETDG